MEGSGLLYNRATAGAMIAAVAFVAGSVTTLSGALHLVRYMQNHAERKADKKFWRLILATDSPLLL